MLAKSYRHLWGYPIVSPATFATIAERGYSGIEAGMPAISDPQQFCQAMNRHRLELVAQVYTAEFSKGHSVNEHLRSLEVEVNRLLPLSPVLINVHSGEDTWSLDQMHRYFRGALELEGKFQVPMAHETHRGRCLFHPTVALSLLEAYPELKLVADLSHWVCVCERLLEDQSDVLALAAERTVHVHCRIGYSQGPQASDPRCEQFKSERETFESWWRTIFESMRRRGLEQFSFCPEYGPAPYLPLMPYSSEPVADLDVLCNWQAGRVSELVRQWQAKKMSKAQ